MSKHFYKLTFFLCTLLLISCSAGPGPGKIPFLNQVTYDAGTTARIAEPTQASVDHYESLLSTSGLNIPLYRCVYEDQVTSYLGIPFDMTIDVIGESMKLSEVKEGKAIDKAYRYVYGPLDSEPAAVAIAFEANGTIAFILSSKSKASGELPSAETLINRFILN